MISKTEHQRITEELSKLFEKCDILHDVLLEEFYYYKDEIISGDYTDDDIEAIIRGTFNDYEVHILSMCIQMFSYENCKDRLEEDKYCVLVDYMKNGKVILFEYEFEYFNFDYAFDEMEKIKVIKKNDTISYKLKKYELLLFMDKILKLNENKKFI